LDDFDNIVSGSGEIVLVSSIAGSDVVEFGGDASWGSAVSSDSVVEVVGTGEGTTDEHVLGPVWSEWVGFIVGVDFTGGPVDITTSDDGVLEDFVSSDGSSGITNRPSISNIDVVLDGDSSFNVSSFSNQSIE